MIIPNNLFGFLRQEQQRPKETSGPQYNNRFRKTAVISPTPSPVPFLVISIPPISSSPTNTPSPQTTVNLLSKRGNGPPQDNPGGFFDTPPPHSPKPPPSSTSQACISPGSTITYVDSNGTTHNYTNLGGNCLGLDVGEVGSLPSNSSSSSSQSVDLHDPFYASVTPQTFALAGATIASAILLILLFLSRTRKPWIQKLAALIMTVSLVTYMVVSVNMLQQQYLEGRYDADALRGVNQVISCQVLSYIAEFVIYLAQIQTLMRIFPRKRDKVIIKWTGLALILLTMIFCGLFDFLQPSAPPPGQRNSAWQTFLQILSPLNYLFSIALATIYALCVIYFGFIHRRVAFTIPAGFILASLSLACITIPIIFFCLDIWAEFVVGWGQYIRSIASIGSTVIIWEWIERVDEAEIKRDGKLGVLGRRIFEDEFDSELKSPSSTTMPAKWKDWSKKMVPNIMSGFNDKATDWASKIQSKLDRRKSTLNPTPLASKASTLGELNASTSPGLPASPSVSDDTHTATSVAGDDYSSTIFTHASATNSQSPLVSGKRAKRKHHYPIARSANRTRQLTLPPSSSSQSSQTIASPSHTNPDIPVPSSPENFSNRTLSNTPSFGNRESDDPRSQFSVLPGFATGDYFLDPTDLEKGRQSGDDSRDGDEP